MAEFELIKGELHRRGKHHQVDREGEPRVSEAIVEGMEEEAKVAEEDEGQHDESRLGESVDEDVIDLAVKRRGLFYGLPFFFLEEFLRDDRPEDAAAEIEESGDEVIEGIDRQRPAHDEGGIDARGEEDDV